MGVGFFDTWYKGATSVVYLGDEKPSTWFDVVEKFSVTIFASSPMYYRQLKKINALNSNSLKSLRLASSAGEKLPQEIIEYWQQAYNIPIYEALGMSEMSTFISFGPAIPARPGSVGKIQTDRKVAILPIESGADVITKNQTGILAIHKSNPGFMLGYLNRPDEMENHFRGDWFITGDLMREDDDSYLWYMGRNDDVLNIAGGHRISPLEIESILQTHPQIDDAICHLGTHDGVENYLMATIIPHDKEKISHSDAESIQHWCKKHLSDNKVPRLISFNNSFPKNPTGKVDRKNIKKHDAISSLYTFIDTH